MPKMTTTFLLYSLLSWAVIARVEPEFNFNIMECQKEAAYSVTDNNQSALTCTGLVDTSNIYWSFTGPSTNGTEIRLGECYDASNGSNPWNCTVFDESYDITRPASNFTTLRFVRNMCKIHGGLIKCSQFNNRSDAQAYCAVQESGSKGPEFHISECSSGFLEVSETQSVSLTCTGLWPVSNIYWSIAGPSTNDSEVRLGNCRLCYPNCSATPCEVLASGYSLNRSRFDVTTLEFLHDLQGNDSVTVKCSQFNNNPAAQVNCTIITSQGNTTPTTGTETKSVTTKATETTSTTEVDTPVNTSAARGTASTNNTIEASGTSAFPLAIVAGGAGAATLVIIFIIVVVVVVRRSKPKKGPTGSEENSHTSGTELDVMSTQNYSDQNNKDGARTSNILHLTPTANPSAHPDQPARQPLTAVVPNESSAVRNSIGPTRYTDGYTYVDINDVPAARTSLNAEQPSKRVAFQPDAINMKTRAKGDNHTEDDSVDYNTDPYDRNRSSQKDNKRSFKVDDDNACKPKARAHTVGPKGDVYSQVNKVRQTAAAKQEKAGYSRDQSPKKQTTTDNVNGADDLKDQKGEDGRVYANLERTSAYNNVIVANTNGDSRTSKRDDADDDNLDDQYNRLQYRRPDPQDDAQYSHIAQL